MVEEEQLSNTALERCLQRSQELEAALVDVLLDEGQYVQWDDSARTTAQ